MAALKIYCYFIYFLIIKDATSAMSAVFETFWASCYSFSRAKVWWDIWMLRT